MPVWCNFWVSKRDRHRGFGSRLGLPRTDADIIFSGLSFHCEIFKNHTVNEDMITFTPQVVCHYIILRRCFTGMDCIRLHSKIQPCIQQVCCSSFHCFKHCFKLLCRIWKLYLKTQTAFQSALVKLGFNLEHLNCSAMIEVHWMETEKQWSLLHCEGPAREHYAGQ